MSLLHLRVVPHLDSDHALVFPIMEFSLDPNINSSLQIIRLPERNNRGQDDVNNHTMAFRSKVVSRRHAEIFIEEGHAYIRDLGSSSGTFLNSRRLCNANLISQPTKLKDKDIIQLGVDYQGGREEIYRCVKMRLALTDGCSEHRNNTNNYTKYNVESFHSLKNLNKPNIIRTTIPRKSKIASDFSIKDKDEEEEEIHVDECCICLYAIAPFQGLFVAPCSHTFHYKCLRPLLKNYPGFLCPLCRTYSDLEANTTMEVEEVKSLLRAANNHNSDLSPPTTNSS